MLTETQKTVTYMSLTATLILMLIGADPLITLMPFLPFLIVMLKGGER